MSHHSIHIRVLGDALHPPSFDSVTWLAAFDPEADDGRGRIELTSDRALAMSFKSYRDAFATYQRVPKCHPVRESDGRPNRPLTAYTIEILGANVEPMITRGAA
jgi:hypothetical protein